MSSMPRLPWDCNLCHASDSGIIKQRRWPGALRPQQSSDFDSDGKLGRLSCAWIFKDHSLS
jgi:hypothetical protein